MAKRPRIHKFTLDDRIVQKYMELYKCNSREAWSMHNRHLLLNNVA